MVQITSAVVRYGWSDDEIKDPEKSCSLFGPALSFHSPSLSNFPKLPETGPKHQLPKFSKQGRKGRGNKLFSFFYKVIIRVEYF